MTFEELQQTATEQETRIFSISCSFYYSAYNTFQAFHFNWLKNNLIHNACWEALIKIQFPFEQLVSNIEFVHTVNKTTGNEKVFEGVSFCFSLFILNRPDITVMDLSVLINRFITEFDNALIHLFKIPMEIKSSVTALELNRTHVLFQQAHKNKLL